MERFIIFFTALAHSFFTTYTGRHKTNLNLDQFVVDVETHPMCCSILAINIHVISLNFKNQLKKTLIIFLTFLLQTTIKVYARCLRSDIEYKTLSITFQTTCKEVVSTLLGKYKMKHRDPKLFYLSMEVTVRKAGVKTHLALDEEARPAVLQSCHPKGDSKYVLQ